MSDLKPDESTAAIVSVLGCVLQQLCSRNDRLTTDYRSMSKFHALRPPAISISNYLQRLAKYAACSGECFVLALVYIDRIIQTNPSFVVNSLNIHRLLIASVMLAAKFFDDQYFNNAYYAKVGGVPCSEINALEVEFLFLCNFFLFVDTETYSQYYTELRNHGLNINNICACSQGPRVPLLVIPKHPHLSLPPVSLEGNVLYPHPSPSNTNFNMGSEEPEEQEFPLNHLPHIHQTSHQNQQPNYYHEKDEWDSECAESSSNFTYNVTRVYDESSALMPPPTQHHHFIQRNPMPYPSTYPYHTVSLHDPLVSLSHNTHADLANRGNPALVQPNLSYAVSQAQHTHNPALPSHHQELTPRRVGIRS